MPSWHDEWLATSMRMRPLFGPYSNQVIAQLSEPFFTGYGTDPKTPPVSTGYIDSTVPNLTFGGDVIEGRYGEILGGRSYNVYDEPSRKWYGPRFSRGRDCRCTLAGGSLTVLSSIYDYTPSNDYTGLTLLHDHIRLRDASTQEPYLVMFAPLVSGTLGESGVYLRAYRPLQNKASGWWLSYSKRMLPVSYSRTVLPVSMCVCEIGTMSNGSFTPQSRSLVWDLNASDASGWTPLPLGLAFALSYSPEEGERYYTTSYTGELRVRAGATADGNFVSSFSIPYPYVGRSYEFWYDAYYDQSTWSSDLPYEASANAVSALSFPFTPSTEDHAVLMERDFYADRDYTYAWWWWRSTWDYGASSSTLSTRVADHAAIERCSFLAGLFAYGGGYSSTAPNAAYWSSFPFSRSPVEVHRDSPPMPPAATQPKQPGPCPLVRSSNEGTFVSPYPIGETQAAASCISAHSNFTEALPISDSANYIDVPASDGSFVLAGKKVLSVEVTFTPYIGPDGVDYDGTPTPRTLPTGIASPVAPPYDYGWLSGLNYFSGDAASQGWSSYGSSWWVKSGTVNMPVPGVPSYGGVSTAYSGRLWNVAAWPSTRSTTDYDTLRELTRTEHDNIIFHEHLRLTSTIHGQTGNTDASTLRDTGHLGIAPLLGSYTLSRFSVGSVPAAGNIFRYAGAGAWSLDRSVDYNFKLQNATISPSFTKISDWGPTYSVTTIATEQTPSVVSVTEDWSLSAAHVEMYAALSTGLQEYGELSTDTSRPDRDEMRSPDQPKGRISSAFVIHELATPPRPAITLSLAARTVMRGDLAMTVTAPGEMSFPYTFSNKASAVAAMCRGSGLNGAVGYVDASGPNGVQSQTTHIDHAHQHFNPLTFSGSQTARLLAGETVTATWWTAKRDGTEGRPVMIQLASDAGKLPRMYSVSLKLNLADL